MKVVVLLAADPAAGRLGHARPLDAKLHGRSVLGHSIARAAAVVGAGPVVLVHPADAPPAEHPGAERFAFHPALDPPAARTARRTARAWSPWAWRGGIGGATVWDELLPAAPLLAAAQAFEADSVVLAGADWPLLDPALSSRMLATHLADPAALPLVFSQTPPGLAPVIVGRDQLEQLCRAENSVGGKPRGHPDRRGFAGLLAYQPSRAQVDPIARDGNQPVPAAVRDTARRFIFDTPAGRTRLERLASALGAGFAGADAGAVAAATLADELSGGRFASLPPLLHVELTPRRFSRGAATPPGGADPPGRAAMSGATIEKIAAGSRGLAVTLGGLGDAACHPGVGEAVAAFRSAGAAGVAVETSLQAVAGPPGAADRRGPEAVSAAVRGWSADALVVRLNAATQAVYAAANGADDFQAVSETLGRLVPDPGVGRLLPVLVKTADNVDDLEGFFERWWQLADHAVIERFPTGGRGPFAIAEDASPVPMDPPWTPPRRTQAKRRLTVLADGTVSPCHQDWHGRATLGNVNDATLGDLWAALPGRPGDPAWSPDASPLCRRCFDFLSLARGTA